MALALHEKGFIVTGSDDEINEPSKSRLAKAGLLPEEIGWFIQMMKKAAPNMSQDDLKTIETTLKSFKTP